jgi:hypothetical protein
MSGVNWYEIELPNADKWQVLTRIAFLTGTFVTEETKQLRKMLLKEEKYSLVIPFHGIVVLGAFVDDLQLPEIIGWQINHGVIWNNSKVTIILTLLFPKSYDRLEAEIAKLEVARDLNDEKLDGATDTEQRKETVNQILNT